MSEATTGKCPAREVLGTDYDHYDPAFALDPHGVYRTLREKCPVSFSENYGGYYVMSKYADIAEILHDASTFSSWPADTPPTPGHTRALIPLEVDAPEHRRYRMIVDPLFRPKAIEHVIPFVREYAAHLVDGMLAKREFDFMTEFAQPFPSAVFLKLVGLEASDDLRDQLCAWSGTILHTTTTPDVVHGDTASDAIERGTSEEHERATGSAQIAARIETGKKLHNFLSDLHAQRSGKRGPDIISTLIDAELPGARKMDRKEILNFAYVMVLAGLDTVTTALGFAFLHLARRPDLQDRLAADPALIPSAIEELLRYESIVHMSRTVTKAHVIRGVQLQPGDRVTVPLASAHRDADIYPDPDEILLDRQIEQSLVFGAGSHRCVGSHLARMEMGIAFSEILRRIPRFSLPPEAELHAYGGQTRSLETLPFRTWRED